MAEQTYRNALAMSQKRLGEMNPDTAGILYGLGTVLEKQDKIDQAEKVYRECLTVCRRLWID